ncbi:MAG: hypothetical protein EOO07_29620 [Chitinophagaceae bacterium]|nr:MAG: hypothetical protein EOO07_29620 [Chitinophagaceae bacterium]
MMRKSIINAIMLMALCLSTNIAFGQKDKLTGVWELALQPGPNGEKPGYSLLRSFDEKGTYTQIVATPGLAYIVSKATFAEFEDGRVKEVISFATDTNRIGKSFNFSYKFSNEGNHQLLITEGGTKVVNGYATVEWREVWRKVEEYKQ